MSFRQGMAVAAASVLACGIGVVGLPAVASAATTYTVTNCNDSGAGSLRQAVLDAADGDTISFSLTCATIRLTSGGIAIDKNITISGPGSASLAISGTGFGRRDVDVQADNVTISGLTITYSHADSSDIGGGIGNVGGLTISSSVVTGNSARDGGGIGNGGNLTLINSTVRGNAGEIDEDHAGGAGGISNAVGATLTVSNSTIAANSGGIGGGGIGNVGTATISDSTIDGNRASTTVDGAAGGGIASGGTLTLLRSRVTNNIAESDGNPNEGGGLALGGTATIDQSTISDNASFDGSGIASTAHLTITRSTLSGNHYNTRLSGDLGGGLYLGGPTTITDSTIADNNNARGSAIYATGTGSARLTHVTVTGNSNPTLAVDGGTGSGLTLTASIIDAPEQCVDTVVDGGYNLADHGNCHLNAANHSLPDTPAELDPAGLADHGGPTLTVGLIGGSPARGLVTDPADCTAIDQTGTAWPTPCDAGAILAGPYTPTTTTLTPSANPSVYRSQTRFTATVTGSDGGTVTFSAAGRVITGCRDVPLTASGALCQTNALPTGTTAVTATYSGSAVVDTSSATVEQVVVPAATTTTLSSSANPSSAGSAVTFTATVGRSDGNGKVTFTTGGSTIAGCKNVALTPISAVFQATCTTAALPPGKDTITAKYSGDHNYAASQRSLTQTVRVVTTTTVVSSNNPSQFGQKVTSTATVAASDGYGTVAFSFDGTGIDGCNARPLKLVAPAYQATCTTTSLPLGADTITAAYGGDNLVTPSDGTVTQTVNRVVTTTSMTSSRSPARSGQSITFTVAVYSSDGQGTVTLWYAGNPIVGCTSMILTAAGAHYRTSCATSALPIGSDTIRAVYQGDHNCFGSTARLTQIVTP